MSIPTQDLVSIYRNALLSRLLDGRFQEWFRSTGGRAIFSGIGSELAGSALGYYLNAEDYLFPRYRGFSAVISKGLSLREIIGEVLRKKCGATKGIGDIASLKSPKIGIPGYSITLGANFGIATGIALAAKIKKSTSIISCMFGDGEASRSTFGSALNLAVLWGLPILFICENNGVSMDTKIEEMSATKTIAQRGMGYGIIGETVKDSEPSLMINKIKYAVDMVRKQQKPFLLEILQTRFTTHISTVEFVPFSWTQIPEDKDPLQILGNEIVAHGIPEGELKIMQRTLNTEIEKEFQLILKEPAMSEEEFYFLYYGAEYNV